MTRRQLGGGRVGPFLAMWALLLAVPAAWANQAIPADTLKDLKAATVFVKVSLGRLSPSGSGFLIQVDGKTGYIVTNAHVVTPPKEIPGRPTVSVVFRSGTKDEQVCKAEVLAADSHRDLALLKVVDVNDMPKPIDIAQKVDLQETMTVYVFGFPFGEALSTTKGNPAITVGKGTVSSIREDDYGEIALVQIDGAINPGNSGGPVLDEKGRLVGVSVATIRGSGIGLAIPPQDVSQMMHGRVGAEILRTVAIENGSAELECEIQFVDPMNKIKTSTLHYLKADGVKELPKPDSKTGRYSLLPKTEKLEVKVDNQKGTARFKIPYDAGNPTFLFQIAYKNGEGKQLYTQPIPYTPRLVAVRPNPGPNPIDPPIEGFPNDTTAGVEGESGKDLESAGRIDDFHSIAFALDANSVLVVGPGRFVRHYSYPEFKFLGAYRMPSIGYRCVLDAKNGLLYTAVADRKAFEHRSHFDRPRGQGDIHIYDVKAILEGKAKPGGDLLPLAELRLDGCVTHMEIAADGSQVYFLENRDRKKPRICRINAAEKTIDKQTRLAAYIDGLRMSKDGKALYAFGSLYDPQDNRQQREGRIQVVNPATLEIDRTILLDVDPFDMALRDDGIAYMSPRRHGGSTPFAVVDLAKGVVVARWEGAAPTQYLAVAPNQKRLYFGYHGGGGAMHSSLLEKELQHGWPKGGGETADHKDRPLGCEFWLTPDNRYAVSRRGAILWLGKNRSDREPFPPKQGNYGITEDPGKDLTYAGGITHFLDLVFALDQKSVFTIGPTRMIRQYSYPDFELKGAYRLQEIGYRAVLDAKRGLLYVATSGPEPVERSDWFGRASGIGDIHVYDVAEVLAGKSTSGNELKLVGDFQLDVSVSHLLLSPDGDFLYYLDIKDREKVKAGKIDTKKKEVVSEIRLAKGTELLCRSKDGQWLFAAGAVGRGGDREKKLWESRIQVIETANWKVEKSYTIDADVHDMAIRSDDILVMTGASGQSASELVFLDPLTEKIVARWAPMLQHLYIAIHPDQSRVYLSYRGGSPRYIHAWTTNVALARPKQPVATGTESNKGPLGGAIYISPDGRFVISRHGSIFWTGKGAKGK